MSGILNLLIAGGNPIVGTWTGSIFDVNPGGSVAGGISIQSAGTISGTNYSGASAWCSGTPPVTYYVKFTVSGSAWNAGLTPGTVYDISTSRSVAWTATGSTKSGTLTVNIYADSGGTILLGTGTVSFTVDGSP